MTLNRRAKKNETAPHSLALFQTASFFVTGDKRVRQSFLEVTTFSHVSPFTHWETSFE